jgi:hypothetical protein
MEIVRYRFPITLRLQETSTMPTAEPAALRPCHAPMPRYPLSEFPPAGSFG